MKRLVTLICAVFIMSQFLSGCTTNNNVQFKELYSQVIGFTEKGESTKR